MQSEAHGVVRHLGIPRERPVWIDRKILRVIMIVRRIELGVGAAYRIFIVRSIALVVSGPAVASLVETGGIADGQPFGDICTDLDHHSVLAVLVRGDTENTGFLGIVSRNKVFHLLLCAGHAQGMGCLRTETRIQIVEPVEVSVIVVPVLAVHVRDYNPRAVRILDLVVAPDIQLIPLFVAVIEKMGALAVVERLVVYARVGPCIRDEISAHRMGGNAEITLVVHVHRTFLGTLRSDQDHTESRPGTIYS